MGRLQAHGHKVVEPNDAAPQYGGHKAQHGVQIQALDAHFLHIGFMGMGSMCIPSALRCRVESASMSMRTCAALSCFRACRARPAFAFLACTLTAGCWPLQRVDSCMLCIHGCRTDPPHALTPHFTLHETCRCAPASAVQSERTMLSVQMQAPVLLGCCTTSVVECTIWPSSCDPV